MTNKTEVADLLTNESFWKTFGDSEITGSSVGLAVMSAHLATATGKTIDERTQRILDKAAKLIKTLENDKAS